ncbi:low molecular weight protein arginine phosphatase [Paenibacillus sp. YPG26]|uniref:low molecular weight protein arginine phosphatase n=1 Tax=Paenibacillus sp. YPG26 TaxID=2878915 RepID=UPI00203C49BC|nr:low molecular weight protein arginine phosphatase [Paenibacillus sp. YPG26]USB32893.1 low molecular weight protein arginine phosphatase [Paenibacillus sp. YPG26]
MRILFVCTGNTCRSPMAEGMLRKLAKEHGVDVEVRSAGVSAADGVQISYHAEAVLRENQIEDLMTSTALRAELTEWADLILTLTQGHKRQVIQYFPGTAGKTFTLKEYVEDDEQVLADIRELDGHLAARELQMSLGQQMSAADSQRMIELRQRIPVYDISDPFGGTREDYDRTAAEIRTALDKLIDILKQRKSH